MIPNIHLIDSSLTELKFTNGCRLQPVYIKSRCHGWTQVYSSVNHIQFGLVFVIMGPSRTHNNDRNRSLDVMGWDSYGTGPSPLRTWPLPYISPRWLQLLLHIRFSLLLQFLESQLKTKCSMLYIVIQVFNKSKFAQNGKFIVTLHL